MKNNIWKKISLEEAFKFWMLIPIYNIISWILGLMLGNIINVFLFTILSSIMLTTTFYIYKGIKKQWNEYKEWRNE